MVKKHEETLKLTDSQTKAFEQLVSFLQHRTAPLFLLRGYAGTGKTTLIGRVADWLEARDRPFELLATTGRAAKVLQQKTGRAVRTVHGCIYAFDEVLGQDGGQLQLNFNLRENNALADDLVFIVDEASMVGHLPGPEGHTARFGSGSLLADLLAFAAGRQLIFVGDPCQLPPVGDDPFSAALSTAYLSRAGHTVHEIELQEIVRQSAGSAILDLAARFRRPVLEERFEKYPKLPAPAGAGALTLHDDHHRLLDAYVRQLQRHGVDSALMICHANWLAGALNRNVRKILFPDWELQRDELLMVVQNSYDVHLANGDQVLLEHAAFDSKRAGFTFLKVSVRALFDGARYETLLIRDLLYNDRPGLTREEVQRLIIDFDKRMRRAGLKRSAPAYREKMLTDPYLNALRAKFGYAVTCHKAQGGEWPEVFLNVHKSIYGMPGPQLYRWYYTALTRAGRRLHYNDGWWVEQFNRRRPDAARNMYRARQNRRK